MTLRRWAIDGKIPFCRVGCERRFSWVVVENMKRGNDSAISRARRGCCPGECPGRTGTSPLAVREETPRVTFSGSVVTVVEDRGSGLREYRPGLNRLPGVVSDGGVSVVRVTCEDRLARFGLGRLRRLFAVHGVVLEVLHPKKSGGRDELLDNVGSLTTTAAGRWYGLRFAWARERLLAETARSVEDRVE
jgi:hypothetical protein